MALRRSLLSRCQSGREGARRRYPVPRRSPPINGCSFHGSSRPEGPRWTQWTWSAGVDEQTPPPDPWTIYYTSGKQSVSNPLPPTCCRRRTA
eukprot:745182-Prorocentrum_minimum.AAC.1